MKIRLTKNIKVAQSIILPKGRILEAYIGEIKTDQGERTRLKVSGYGTPLGNFDWEAVIEDNMRV